MVAIPSNTPVEVHRPPATIIAPADVDHWNWPIRDDGWYAIGPVGIFLAAVAIGVWQGSDWRLPTATGAIAALALWRLWIPVRFELGVNGVTQNYLGFSRRIPWIAVHRFDVEPTGVWLFPTNSTKPARYVDGIFIRFGNRRSEIMSAITYYLGAWTTSSESPTRTEMR